MNDELINVHFYSSECLEPYSLKCTQWGKLGELKQIVICQLHKPSPETYTSTAFRTSNSSTDGTSLSQHSIVTNESVGSLYLNIMNADSYYNINNFKEFYLLYLDEMRNLDQNSSLGEEGIKNNANILVLRHGGPDAALDWPRSKELMEAMTAAKERGHEEMVISDGPVPTLEEERIASMGLKKYEKNRLPASAENRSEPERRLLLRRVYIGMSHCCLRHMGNTRTTQQVFQAVLQMLEKRHKSSIQPESIKKLMDMGFEESKAVMALTFKSCVEDAAEWLVENKPEKRQPPSVQPRDLTDQDDPVNVLMPLFWEFRRNYFLPNPKFYDTLLQRHTDSTKVFDVLMQTDNDCPTSHELLLKERLLNVDLIYAPLESTHPIMSSIMESATFQSALNKPKMLYALMALCENPDNSNLWLSDPDTTAVIRLVINTHHEERFNMKCDQPAN